MKMFNADGLERDVRNGTEWGKYVMITSYRGKSESDVTILGCGNQHLKEIDRGVRLCSSPWIWGIPEVTVKMEPITSTAGPMNSSESLHGKSSRHLLYG